MMGLSGPLIPPRELRYLHTSELSQRPAIALFLHGLFDNVLHLRDRAVFPDKFSIPVTKAAIGLTLASIAFRSAAAGVFRKRHPTGLALLHRSPLG